MNTFGSRLRLTTFGESHGAAIGGVIDGLPSGLKVDFEAIAKAVESRRPGRPGVSPRREKDIPEFLSGITPEGITLGTPIAFIVRNEDVRSEDYDMLKDSFRPNHADYTYQARYGIRDHRGGGRASARETLSRVIAGSLAEQFLANHEIHVSAFLSKVGEVGVSDIMEYLALHPNEAAGFSPSEKLMEEMMSAVEQARRDSDSIGGEVVCVVSGLKAGIGNPVYDKLNARLAEAMMSINAAKGFEIGGGFALASLRGSQVVDKFYVDSEGGIKTNTNYSGGIQGGISNGMPIVMRVAFKPTPTIGLPLPLLTENGESKEVKLTGRHDPCVAVRAVPVVRAMAALTIADFLI